MNTILTAILNLISSANPAVAIIVALGTTILAVFSYFNTLWSSLFVKIGLLSSSSFGTSDFSPLSLLNYIIPLDTLLTFISAYLAVLLICAIIRIIKSFMPTIAS